VRHHAELDRDCVDLARDPSEQERGWRRRRRRSACPARSGRRSTIPFAGFTYRRDITRAELERLVEPLVTRTSAPPPPLPTPA